MKRCTNPKENPKNHFLENLTVCNFGQGRFPLTLRDAIYHTRNTSQTMMYSSFSRNSRVFSSQPRFGACHVSILQDHQRFLISLDTVAFPVRDKYPPQCITNDNVQDQERYTEPYFCNVTELLSD